MARRMLAQRRGRRGRHPGRAAPGGAQAAHVSAASRPFRPGCTASPSTPPCRTAVSGPCARSTAERPTRSTPTSTRARRRPPAAAWTLGPDAQMLARERRRQIERAIASLPEVYRGFRPGRRGGPAQRRHRRGDGPEPAGRQEPAAPRPPADARRPGAAISRKAPFDPAAPSDTLIQRMKEEGSRTMASRTLARSSSFRMRSVGDAAPGSRWPTLPPRACRRSTRNTAASRPASSSTPTRSSPPATTTTASACC